MQPPSIETAMTSDGLKYERCVENWFDHTVIFGKSPKNVSAFEYNVEHRPLFMFISNNGVFC